MQAGSGQRAWVRVRRVVWRTQELWGELRQAVVVCGIADETAIAGRARGELWCLAGHCAAAATWECGRECAGKELANWAVARRDLARQRWVLVGAGVGGIDVLWHHQGDGVAGL